MITKDDLKHDMKLTNESDVFYYDSLLETGYHMHEKNNGEEIFMKNTGKQIRFISEEKFFNEINKNHVSGSTADTYYEIERYGR